jgi:ABC-type dipeptide/oligopeptide/nickel transport system permease component
MRLTASGMLDGLTQDYIRTARAKGVGEAWAHAANVSMLRPVSAGSTGLAFNAARHRAMSGFRESTAVAT